MAISSGPISNAAISALAGLRRESVIQSLTLSDQVTLISDQLVQDPIWIDDEVSYLREVNRSASNTLNLTDQAVGVREFTRDVVDNLTLDQSLYKYFFEHTLNLSDSVVRVRPRSLTDSFTPTDQVSYEKVGLLQQVSQSLTLSHSLTLFETYAEVVVHTIGISHDMRRVVEGSASNTIGITDTLSHLYKPAYHPYNDLTLTDSVATDIFPGQNLSHDLNLIQGINLTRDIFEIVEQTISIDHDPVTRFIFQQDITHDIDIQQTWVFFNFEQKDMVHDLGINDSVIAAYPRFQNLSDHININHSLAVENFEQQDVLHSLSLIQNIGYILTTTRPVHNLNITDAVTHYNLAQQNVVQELDLTNVADYDRIFTLEVCDCLELEDDLRRVKIEALVDTLTLTDSAVVDPFVHTIGITDSVTTNAILGDCCRSAYIPDKHLQHDLGITDSVGTQMDNRYDFVEELQLLSTAAYYVEV